MRVSFEALLTQKAPLQLLVAKNLYASSHPLLALEQLVQLVVQAPESLEHLIHGLWEQVQFSTYLTWAYLLPAEVFDASIGTVYDVDLLSGIEMPSCTV